MWIIILCLARFSFADYNSLRRFRKLEILDLSDNLFNSRIFPFLNSATSLKSLSLWGNNMGGPFPAKGVCLLEWSIYWFFLDLVCVILIFVGLPFQNLEIWQTWNCWTWVETDLTAPYQYEVNLCPNMLVFLFNLSIKKFIWFVSSLRSYLFYIVR